MVGIELGNGVEHIAWGVGIAALGQSGAFDGQALFDFGGEQRARFQKDELVVEVAKSVFGFQVQVELGTCGMALQGFLDFGQQVGAADQKLHGFVEDVQGLAQGVHQGPGQCDHAR